MFSHRAATTETVRQKHCQICILFSADSSLRFWLKNVWHIKSAPSGHLKLMILLFYWDQWERFVTAVRTRIHLLLMCVPHKYAETTVMSYNLIIHICFSPQLSAELHPSRVSDSVLSCLSADVHPAGERSWCSSEQLLHHQPDGGLILILFLQPRRSNANAIITQSGREWGEKHEGHRNVK